MSTVISSLLIPFTQVDSILVPRELVECVLPYAMPLPSGYKHDALVGSLIYKDAKIPVLNLIHLDQPGQHASLPENSYGKYRIVMLSCTSENSFCDSYAVIASNPPSLFEIGAENMTAVNSLPSPFFFSKIRLNMGSGEQLAYIPNLDKLEEELLSNTK